MKAIFLSACLLFLSGMAGKLSYAASLENLAVMDFKPNNTSAGDAAAISEFVRSAFVESRTYAVVDKSNMDRILAEQAFQQTGCTDSDCAVKLGKLLNVKKMVVGSYSIMGGVRFLNASLVDVETGRIINTARVKGFEPGQADRAAENLVQQLGGEAPITEIERPDISKERPKTKTGRNLSIGIKGGLNAAKIYTDADYDVELDYRYEYGFIGGLFLDLRLSRIIDLHTEFLYSSKGFELEWFTYNGSLYYKRTETFRYFEVPVLMKLVLRRERSFRPFIAIGPSLAIIMSADGMVEYYSYEWTGNIADSMKTFDFGLLGALGFDIPAGKKRLTFDVRYDLGLTPIYEWDDSYNRVISAMLGIAF